MAGELSFLLLIKRSVFAARQSLATVGVKAKKEHRDCLLSHYRRKTIEAKDDHMKRISVPAGKQAAHLPKSPETGKAGSPPFSAQISWNCLDQSILEQEKEPVSRLFHDSILKAEDRDQAGWTVLKLGFDFLFLFFGEIKAISAGVIDFIGIPLQNIDRLVFAGFWRRCDFECIGF